MNTVIEVSAAVITVQSGGSHMRSAFAPVYDFRKPIEKVRDGILDRLEFTRAA
jgi:hypothetical protein